MNRDFIAQKYNISPLVVELLEKRGIDSEQKLQEFLNPNDQIFYNPFLLKGMDRLVERIKKAMANNEKVLIFGDYDVDGVSASAILIKYFASQNFYVDYYLPNRYIDGYGLTNDTLLKVKEKYSPNLIITVDCGIACHDEVEFGKTIGIDILITDHHDIPEVVPDTIVIDPKMEGQDYPFKFLCGTGVAFKIVQALSGLEEARKYLGIAAIATIADIVPLQDENRAIVKLGMKDFDKNLPLGIKMLFEENKLSLSVSSTDIAFKLTPKINAAGRMGDASVALKLYIKNDKIFLKNTIETLGNLNTQRQALCNKVYEDAIEKLSKINIANYSAIVLYDKDWDSGILGIVAARIAGEFNRPTVLLSEIGDELKGSARSVNDIDIFTAISSFKEVLEAFGGHKMAAGLTIKKKNFVTFMQSFNNYLSTHYKPIDFLPAMEYDATLKEEDFSQKLVDDLSLLEPCGCGNPKPIFNVVLDEKASFSTMPKHPNHLTIFNKNLNIIAFNSYKYLPLLKNTANRQIQIELQESFFRNKKYVKGIAKNITTGTITRIRSEEFVFGEYLKQLYYKENETKIKFSTYDKSQLNKFISQAKTELFGTLFVCNTYASYREFCDKIKESNLQHYIFEIISNSGLNSVVLAPTNFQNFGAYKKIIFVDTILSMGYIQKVLQQTSAQIMLPKVKSINPKIFTGLKTDRQTFGNYFRLFSEWASKQGNFFNDVDFYKNLLQLDKKISYKQFIFCLYVFIELGIFEFVSEMGLLSLKENKKVVSNLNNSDFYNLIGKKINESINYSTKKNTKPTIKNNEVAKETLKTQRFNKNGMQKRIKKQGE